MKTSLMPGIEHSFTFRIPETKTVPALYPEAEEFQSMPHVLATGFMVGLFEWTCIQAVNPHLEWPEEQTVGTHIAVSHLAATPPGLRVTTHVKIVAVEGRRLRFEIEAHDGVDTISKGTHERVVIQRSKFSEKLRQKAATADR